MAPLHIVGAPLSFAESKAHLKAVRRRGVQQFIQLYQRVEHAQTAELLWGDELEYHVLKLFFGSGDNDSARTVKLSLRAPELLNQLAIAEGSDPRRIDGCAWHAEYGTWMVEATPREPYGGYATELLRVERSMRLRRQRLLSVLAPDEIITTMPTFPLMGVGEFTHPHFPVNGPNAQSSCVPDEATNPHPRMQTLTANIRARRGSNVDVRIPLYKDVATPEFKAAEVTPESKAPTVAGDAMAFGMGNCCLQVTFQARDVHESRFLTDQLAVLAPIFLALTAATPVFKGRLVDTDVRWAAIEQAVDDRTPAERRAEGEAVPEGAEECGLAGDGVRRFAKSRYASISHYIYDCPVAKLKGEPNPTAELNDLNCDVDPEIATMLREAGIDEMLTQHIAYNFSRDPLVIFRERLEVEDTTEDFESLQSTNWNSVRWKPPPTLDSPIGWRTEFRSMEVQMTDFENAAFCTVVMLLTRAILAFDLDLLVPLSKVDENMHRAHDRDAISTQKFHFRKHLAPPRKPGDVAPCRCSMLDGSSDTEEMTLAEVLNGKGSYFPGLLPLCGAYVDSIRFDAATRGEVHKYMKLLALRASGQLQTNAQWQRELVTTHDDYRFDSVVSPAIAHDLALAVHEVGIGKRACKEVLGEVIIDPILPVDAWDIKLESSRMEGSTHCQLLHEYMNRPCFMNRLKSETKDEVFCSSFFAGRRKAGREAVYISNMGGLTI
mmetsp:Transcript_23206/g.53705  ORF Transcript_23206/g.53705 Transcript_23206/m.53705 type:complete len:719 (+) Transcript_23206:73-2229(+)